MHYNLFSVDLSQSSFQEVEQKKEALRGLFAKTGCDLYSIMQESGKKRRVSEIASLLGDSKYKAVRKSNFFFSSDIIYNTKVLEKISESVYDYESYGISYFQFRIRENGEKLHVFTYKINNEASPFLHHQAILSLIEKKGLKKNILLMGGLRSISLSSQRSKYFSDTDPSLEFINPFSSLKLYDDKGLFYWDQKVFDFVYLSRNLIYDNEKLRYVENSALSVNKKIDNQYFSIAENAVAKLEEASAHPPLFFVLKTQGDESQTQSEDQLENIVTNSPFKDELELKLKWDSPRDLDVKVTSIIGNTIYNQQVSYESGVETYQVDLSGFPKGIYLLKISEESSKDVIIQKLIKY